MMTTPKAFEPPRTMPSREFLVRQAVLNAASELYPLTMKLYVGRAAVFDTYLHPAGTWPEISELFRLTRVHFANLVASFGGTTCPSL